MILVCPDCGSSLDWSLSRVGNQPILASKCRHCDPAGPWHQEPVEVIRKPRGRAGLWPVASDVPIAPVDFSEV
jgi:hypothetical protein